MKFFLAALLLLLGVASGHAQTTPTARYANVQAMLNANIPSTSSAMSALVFARTTADDNGGGLFFYASSSTSTTNWGTIFKPTSSNGRWLRQFDGSEIPINWCGADPTGAADSRNAIQAAANIAATMTNGTVVVPLGQYRVVQTPLSIMLNTSMVGRGGKLWNSLPTGYVNPNGAEVYTATNVLTTAGTYTNVTYSSAWTGAWNGKGEMFTPLGSSVIKDLIIDGGWGSTSTPTGVVPIFGINDSTDEYTYYQTFHTSEATTYSGNTFQNIPGVPIEGGYNVTVSGNHFGEFGDHIFYFGQTAGTQTNYVFSGNQILTGRAATGTAGQTNRVGASTRSLLKFRGNQNFTVTGNVANNFATVPKTIFCEIGVDSAEPGYAERFTITGNTFRGERGIDLYAVRSTTSIPAVPAGYKVRSGIITGNTFSDATYGVYCEECAIENVAFSGNTFTNVEVVAKVLGSLYYTNAVANLSFSENLIYQSASGTQPAFSIGGSIQSLFLYRNRAWSLNTTTLRSFVAMQAADASGFPGNNMVQVVSGLTQEDNRLNNYDVNRTDNGYTAYAGGTTYPFTTSTMDDGVRQRFCVVSSGGSLWANTATTTGVAPPTVPWVAWTRDTTRHRLINNYKIGNISGASNSFWLVYGSADSTRKHNYTLTTRFNENYNPFGDPIVYDLGTGSTVSTNLWEWNGVAFNPPIAQGAANSFLKNDGTGLGSWVAPTTLSTNHNVVTDGAGALTTVTYATNVWVITDSGGNLTTTGPPTGGTAGTVINTGTPLTTAIPIFNGTDGTNVIPSKVTVTGLTNLLSGTLTGTNLSGSFALASDSVGKVVPSATTATELGYSSGITSVAAAATRGFVPSGGAPLQVYMANIDGSYGWNFFPVVDELMGGIFTAGFGWTTGGTGGSTLATGTGVDGHFGIFNMSTVVTIASNTGVRTYINNGVFGSQTLSLRGTFLSPAALSDVNTTYQFYIGFGDSASAEPTDGAYLVYDSSVSANWFGRVSNNSSRTASSGGGGSVAVATATWYDFIISGNSTTVTFYVSSDGGATYTNIGSCSGGNIPTAAGREFGISTYLVCSGGMSIIAKTVLLDRFALKSR